MMAIAVRAPGMLLSAFGEQRPEIEQPCFGQGCASFRRTVALRYVVCEGWVNPVQLAGSMRHCPNSSLVPLIRLDPFQDRGLGHPNRPRGPPHV
jgi:hypothetical protein